MLSAPSGKPIVGRELGDAQQRQARVLGRLDDARVAGRERAADRAAEDLQRIVPRDDVAGDAVRLAPREHRVAGRIRNRLAVQLVAGAAVELEVARARRDVGARLLHRLAAVARLDQRELVGVIEDRAPSRARSRPFSTGASRPHAPSRARSRRAHRRVDVVRVAARDRGERLAVGRIDHRQRRAGAGGDPAVADEMRRRGRDRRQRLGRVHGGAIVAAARSLRSGGPELPGERLLVGARHVA